jgi:hypothetical protein
MNILITDLRMTQDNGGVSSVDVTNNRRVTVRVPTVFGFVCELTGTGIVAALVATDSFQLATSKYGGFAVRDSVTGIYSYSSAGSGDTIRTAGAARCHGAPANQYADTTRIAGRVGGVYVMSPAPPGITAIGSPMFVWQTVSYEFKNSTIYPGRLGLYRTVLGRAATDSTSDELIAPFAATARFSYYTINPYGTRDSALAAPPGNLNNIRGFRIFLPAESSDTMPTRNTPQSSTVSTAVFFKNTRFP